MDDDDDVEKEESIVVVVAAAFANITVQILCLETIEIEYCCVCDSPRVACFLRLLLSAGATRDVPMDEEKSFRIYFWISRSASKLLRPRSKRAKKKAVSSVVFVLRSTNIHRIIILLQYTRANTWHHDFVHGERTTPSGNVACCAISPNKRRMSFGFTDSVANKFTYACAQFSMLA